MTHQTNALRLADLLELDPSQWGGVAKVAWPAASELRRLSAIEQERDQLRAKLEVAEASAKAAISKAEWQAVTNTELNQLRAQLAVLKDGKAGGEVVQADDELIRTIGNGLLNAHDHLEMHKLERSHCNSADRIREGLAAFAAYKKRPDFATPKPVPMTGWQPIETAPKDGSYVLLSVGADVVVSRWYVHYLNGKPDRCRKPEWEQADMYGGFGSYMGPLRPTHWMPLPPPKHEISGVTDAG